MGVILPSKNRVVQTRSNRQIYPVGIKRREFLCHTSLGVVFKLNQRSNEKGAGL